MYELRCEVIFIFNLKKLVSREESRANRINYVPMEISSHCNNFKLTS